MNSVILLILLVLNQAFCIWYITKNQKQWLGNILLLNMMLVALLGEKLFVVCGLTVSAAGVCYSFICTTKVIKRILSDKDDIESLLEAIPKTLFEMLFLLIISQIIVALPGIKGNEEFSSSAIRVLSHSPAIVVGAFLGFIVSQSAMIKIFLLMENYNLFGRYITATVLCQIIVSIIFYPIAFSYLDLGQLVALIVGSCLINILIMLGLFPLIKLAYVKAQKN
jgi:uncharacterized PurR-regulated membrane protein YhhQ (DUF165 family)